VAVDEVSVVQQAAIDALKDRRESDLRFQFQAGHAVGVEAQAGQAFGVDARFPANVAVGKM
jgi:hypothetical protein